MKKVDYITLEIISFFYKREKPGYRMLYNGRTLAQKLGVESNGYPTVMIADRQQKLVYIGDFDKNRIESVLINKLALTKSL